MARLFYGHVPVDGVRINYYRTGGEKPPVILLHGFSDNALCWNRVPLYLELEYDVVMPDARGHGGSGMAETGSSPEVQAHDVLRVIEELDLKHPVLIGHSMGAHVAALAAAQAPQIIRGVVLSDPPWRDGSNHTSPGVDAMKLDDWKTWISSLKQKSLEEVIALGKQLHPNWDESEFFQWARAKQQVRPETVEWITASPPLYAQIVRQIRCPGLLITADPRLGAVVTPDVAEQVRQLWRKVKVVHIPGAGHNIHREQLSFYMDAVLRFLRSLGKWKNR
jgi:pimeloyl-ACP methyl ester carboxylesterase